MILLSAFLSLSCPIPKLMGFKAPLTQQESESFNRAKRGCVEHYPDAPCLKSFEKREERVFWAICGKPK